MIPGKPRAFDPASREDELFEALRSLPEEYIVIHSCNFVSITGGMLRDSEADFIVFHKDLGILVIEAKAGMVTYADGVWHHGTAQGPEMKHEGPFQQAKNIVYRIKDRFEQSGCSELWNYCKVMYAVWFPYFTKAQIDAQFLPPDCERKLILTSDDLTTFNLGIESRSDAIIRRLFNIRIDGASDTHLDESQAKRIVEQVLCPEFSLVPIKKFEYYLAEVSFARLYAIQEHVLEFLAYQRFTVVEGAAGTGKTLIAVERAKRASANGDRVLFLCYNAELRDDVRDKLSECETVDVKTLSELAGDYGASSPKESGRFKYLGIVLEDMFQNNTFPYRHVVIDEGQDFGKPTIEEAGILGALQLAVLQNAGGTLYFFCDKRQLVQSPGLPAFINEADCKLTLYANCRNSKSIAECSMSGLEGCSDSVVNEGVEVGGKPQLFVSDSVEKQAAYVTQRVSELSNAGIGKIVILTCSSEKRTAFKKWIKGEKYDKTWIGTNVKFDSCRRFKGLEADAIILVDVEPSVWGESSSENDAGHGAMFYAGASRAKFDLSIVCNMTKEDCRVVLSHLDKARNSKPEEKLAKVLKASLVS